MVLLRLVPGVIVMVVSLVITDGEMEVVDRPKEADADILFLNLLTKWSLLALTLLLPPIKAVKKHRI